MPNVHFLLCGDGITWQNRELSRCIEDSGIHENCHLLGRREDIPRLMASLDIAASSSFGEGFSNVIGEAMACGVPCVVTDVGDSAFIVGDSGVVIPPRDPAALEDAWKKLIDMGANARKRLGESARKRIENNFSLSLITGHYEKLYREMSLQCAV
jgi:glycosyltransferase involved in cell wall biosynthesis